MSRFNEIKVKYFHAAVPPEGINTIDIYTLCEDERGIYLTDGNRIFDFSYDYIKMLFHPVCKSWREIERGIK